MYLQQVNNVFDLTWTDKIAYGDIHHETEVQFFRYNFEQADVAMLMNAFQSYEAECKRLLARTDQRVTLPAYDYCIKSSHAFNLLDARGADQCRRAYRLHRPRACTGQTMRRAVHRRACGNGASAPCKRGSALYEPALVTSPKGPPDEAHRPTSEPIGNPGPRRGTAAGNRCRGVPYQFIAPALVSLRDAAARLFEEARLSSGTVATYGTPRRLVLVVENLALHQTGVKKEVMGPSRSVGFDQQGQPTKAAIGFATGQGLSVENLQVRQTSKGEYLFAVKEDAGRAAKTVLLELLPQLIGQLSFPKAMKWNEAAVRFARPVRWLVALFDGAVVPMEAAGIKAGNRTYGHRVMGRDGPISVRNYKSPIAKRWNGPASSWIRCSGGG